jgi:hypothetical protein
MLLCENLDLSHEMEGSMAVLQIATLPSETATLNFHLQHEQNAQKQDTTIYVTEPYLLLMRFQAP